MAQIEEEYIERAFQIWYSNNRPASGKLQELLPEPKPAQTTLTGWRETHNWDERADVMDAQAIRQVEPELINARAEMFRQQLKEAKEIKSLALEKLRADGFDNSSSATNALFKAVELESKVTGSAEMLERISKMTPEQLQARVSKLLQRKNEAEELVEGEIEEVDAESNSTT